MLSGPQAGTPPQSAAQLPSKQTSSAPQHSSPHSISSSVHIGPSVPVSLVAESLIIPDSPVSGLVVVIVVRPVVSSESLSVPSALLSPQPVASRARLDSTLRPKIRGQEDRIGSAYITFVATKPSTMTSMVRPARAQRTRATTLALCSGFVVTCLACAPESSDPGALTLAEAESLAANEGSDAETSAATETTGPVLDLPQPEGCTKVDLLFVVDNSHSMGTEQGALVESFPEFMDDLYATLDATDSYHVGVVTTDAYAFNEPGCQELGALVTTTGGTWSSNTACGPFSGGPFMTEAEDLAASFTCAAQVGTEGSIDERPIEAMLEALGPNQAAGCNAGFFRDDALLVVVLITDEEDDHELLQGQAQGSPGDPSDWFAALVELVDIEENAVILTIAGGHPENVCGFPVGATAEDAPRLQAFTEMFTHAYLGDICAGSFAPFFATAVEVIDLACEGFTPVP